MCEYPQSDTPPKFIKKFFLLESETIQDVTVWHVVTQTLPAEQSNDQSTQSLQFC